MRSDKGTTQSKIKLKINKFLVTKGKGWERDLFQPRDGTQVSRIAGRRFTIWATREVCSERIALKQVYYQVWNRSPAQVGCMRQVLRDSALGRPRGMGCGWRWDGGWGWGTHVNPWLIHVNVWQKPLQYCKVISLQLIKINEKNK